MLVKCGLCKGEIENYIEGTAQCHKDCFTEFLISFNIPEKEVVQKVEHIMELKPDEKSFLLFRLGTELIPASQKAINDFRDSIKDMFADTRVFVTSTLVDVKVVRLEE